MQVRAWYGLNGTIDVENQLWHLVKIGPIALPHPPVVNLFLRRGLSSADRLRLSYLHEYGHLQTLPAALLHLLLLAWYGRGRRVQLGWFRWLAALVIAHEAVWELLSEAYAMLHEGPSYHAVYRHTPNRLMPLFWIALGGLAVGLSRWVAGPA